MNTQAPKKFKVLLIGDIGIDEYQYGVIDRLSPEAPVPVFKPTYKIIKSGMAANVEENLKALNLNVDLIGSEKSIKTRLIDERSKQHIVRIDNDIVLDTSLSITDIKVKLSEYDSLIISDYEKGLISYELIENLRMSYDGPIFIDTKKTDLIRFKGCYVKINELEYSKAKTLNDLLIVTLGARGAMFKQDNVEIIHEQQGAEVVDVCGAGDTFLAALVYKYLHCNNVNESIRFANKAASITVKNMGVYAPTLEEINETTRIR